MKIQHITNHHYTYFKASENKPESKTKQTDSLQKAAIYITAAAALGLSAYFIFRNHGKKINKPKISDDIKPEPPKTPQQEAPTKKEVLPLTPPPDYNKPNVGPLPYEPDVTRLEDFKPFFDGNFEIKKADFQNGSTTTYYKNEGDETFKDILVFNKENKLFRRILQYRRADGQMWSRVYKGDESKILVNPKKFPKSIYDSDFLVKEFSGDAKKPLGQSDISEGYERLTRVAYPDGTAKTHQGFFNKNKKLHDYTIYYEKFNNNLGCFDRLHESQPEYAVKYNYAYKNGKLSAIAKQDVLKYNNWHGVYQNNGFDPFPQYLDFRDGKGFNEFKGDFYLKYPEFDPDNF